MIKSNIDIQILALTCGLVLLGFIILIYISRKQYKLKKIQELNDILGHYNKSSESVFYNTIYQ